MAEPAGGAGEVRVPGLIDHAPAGRPRVLLPQAVEAVGRLGIHAQAEVVPEQPLHLRPHAPLHQPAAGAYHVPVRQNGCRSRQTCSLLCSSAAVPTRPVSEPLLACSATCSMHSPAHMLFCRAHRRERAPAGPLHPPLQSLPGSAAGQKTCPADLHITGMSHGFWLWADVATQQRSQSSNHGRRAGLWTSGSARHQALATLHQPHA